MACRDDAIRPGVFVRICGLKSAPHLNGLRARCGRWYNASGRWGVFLPGGEEKRVKADNLTVDTGTSSVDSNAENLTIPDKQLPWLQWGSVVRFEGLQAVPELNGKLAVCEQWHASDGRWGVRLENGGEKRVRPANLLAASEYGLSWPGVMVRICGLKSSPELNGTLAICETWHPSTRCWELQLENGERKVVEIAQLLLDEVVFSQDDLAHRFGHQSDRSGSQRHSENNVDDFVVDDRMPLTCYPLLRKKRPPAHKDTPIKEAPSSKRRRNDDMGRSRKAFRQDDTLEERFQLRQTSSMDSAKRTSSVALRPKLHPQEVPATSAECSEDLQVADGLRCPRWLWEALYGYQQDCLKWLWGRHLQKGGAILADDTGLGKTIEIAAYLASLHHSKVLQGTNVQQSASSGAALAGGVLIVCPATLISQWQVELNLWYPSLRICVMHDVSADDRCNQIQIVCEHHGVLITSYETMLTASEDVLEAPWIVVVLDEGHRIRNPHARTTLIAKQISTPHRILLSSSPVQNNMQEFWSLIDFVCPGHLGTLPVFLDEVAKPIQSGGAVDANETREAVSYQCALALRELTMPCILRRTKAAVMKELVLPAKKERVLMCSITKEQYAAYMGFVESQQTENAQNSSRDLATNGTLLFAVGVLRKICNHPDLLLQGSNRDNPIVDFGSPQRSGKMKVLVQLLTTWKKEGRKVLIFSQTMQVLAIIENWLLSESYQFLRVDGKTPVSSRLKLINAFNADSLMFAMLLTTRVGGVGLNITGADRVIIYDPDWNPMIDMQARERAWRIGQKKEVEVYRLVLSGTLEEKIYQVQVNKQRMSQKVLSNPYEKHFFDTNLLTDLFAYPPCPPGLTSAEIISMKKQMQSAFGEIGVSKNSDFSEETDGITKHVLESQGVLKQAQSNSQGNDELSVGLQTLFDADGLKWSFSQDNVENMLAQSKSFRVGAEKFAEQAFAALKRSSQKCTKCPITEPTWTGKYGSAGGPKHQATKRHLSEQAICHVKKCLLKLEAAGDIASDIEKRFAEDILRVFLDNSLAGDRYHLTSDQVLKHASARVGQHQNDTFKAMLKCLCELAQADEHGSPATWTLHAQFRPK